MYKLSFYFQKCFLLIVIFSCFLIACQTERGKDYRTWESYRGDEGSNAYSKLHQINTGNIKQLAVAWTYNSGDKSDYLSLESSPIIINGILYAVSPRLKTFALDAKTGKQLWVFDPFGKWPGRWGYQGLNLLESEDEQRIFMFASNKLIALDAETGKQIKNFGDSGYVNLNRELR